MVNTTAIVNKHMSKALRSYSQEDYNKCTANLVKAMFSCASSDKSLPDNFQVFMEIAIQANYQPMIEGIINKPHAAKSVDYLVLNVGLMLADNYSIAGDLHFISVTNCVRGLDMSSLCIAHLVELSLTSIPLLPYLTLPTLYSFVAIFLMGLTNPELALESIVTAQSLLGSGKHDSFLDAYMAIYASANGKCVVCCTEMAVGTVVVEEGDVGYVADGDCICRKCKVLSYCSRKCQRKHYRGGHKEECEIVRKAVERINISVNRSQEDL
jgi:hypothetical protein